MSLLEAILRKLSKDEVINLLLHYQIKFNKTLTRMTEDRSDLIDLKQNFIKLESELSVARQVSNKLKELIVSLERQCWVIPSIIDESAQELVVSLKKTCQNDLEVAA